MERNVRSAMLLVRKHIRALAADLRTCAREGSQAQAERLLVETLDLTGENSESLAKDLEDLQAALRDLRSATNELEQAQGKLPPRHPNANRTRKRRRARA